MYLSVYLFVYLFISLFVVITSYCLLIFTFGFSIFIVCLLFLFISVFISLFVFMLLFTDSATHLDEEDLYAELNIMKKIKPHPNIINLLGYCTKPSEKSIYLSIYMYIYPSSCMFPPSID